MQTQSERTMFMIYKDVTYTDKYMVCYFTELGEHNKEKEFNKALAGEHYYDGFLNITDKRSAKKIISRFVDRLNSGEDIDPSELEGALGEFIAR